MEKSKAFDAILDEIEEEHYERCTTVAREFLQLTKNEKLEPLRSYAKYFKLFAQSYRSWQVSYSYNHIRNGFNLAHYLLNKELKPFINNGSRIHDELSKCFSCLSKMLCSYTVCENSFISNDPLSLLCASAECVRQEQQAIRILDGLNNLSVPLPVPYDRIRKWMTQYFKINLLLHTGLNACAVIYMDIFKHGVCNADLFALKMNAAKKSLRELEPKSQELASELNAHIQHVSNHFHRLYPEHEPSFLNIKEGRLVLSMSASFSRPDAIYKVFTEDDSDHSSEGDISLNNFIRLVKDAFKDSSLPTKFRRMKLHDIFETSFGAERLKAIAFGLPKLELHFLEKKYVFEIRVTTSALGTSTIYFTLDIGGENNPGPLSVEEARAIQSCICPHSGQVKLRAEKDPAANPIELCTFNFIKRFRLYEFISELDKLTAMLNEPGSNFPPALTTTAKDLKTQIEAIIEQLLRSTNDIEYSLDQLKKPVPQKPAPRKKDSEESDSKEKDLIHNLIELLNKLDTLRKKGVEQDKIAKFISDFLNHFNSFDYLYDVAQMHLETLHKALLNIIESDSDHQKHTANDSSKALAKRAKNWRLKPEKLPLDHVAALCWKLIPDSGWYSYLHLSKLEKIGFKDSQGEQVTDFRKISDHPDTIGFIMEQREARASFDDWRFVMLDKEEISRGNLAHIRSHISDAFYVSEYQSFLFMPDDPKFLMDQYEATVELMIRIGNKLKGYNSIADEHTLKPKHLDLLNDWSLSRPRSLSERWHSFRHASSRKVKKEEIKEEIKNLYTKVNFLEKLHWEAKDLRNLALKANISRYKDHGKLMNAIVERMNINHATILIDRHIIDLQAIYGRLHDELKQRRDSGIAKLIPVASGFIAFTAISSFVEACFQAYGVLGEHDPMVKGMAKIVLMMIVALLIWRTSREKHP